MAPKSERFEMRLDEDILARVDKWRSEQGDVPSRAEAMRRLLELGLTRGAADAVKFSDGEKLLFMMMRDLYRHFEVTSPEVDVEFISDVIVGGHYWAPRWELQGLYHDHEDNIADVRLVVDVLGMWTFIESGYAKLTKKEKDRIEAEVGPLGRSVQFTGFDGNNEASLVSIARFFVERMGRFSAFKGRDLNSHVPVAEAYKRMVLVFEPMRVGLIGTELSASQIIKILQSGSSI